MKKKAFTSALMMFCFFQVFACELCKSQQPELLKDIVHGTGPQGTFDFIILWVAIIIVLATLVLSVLFLIKPDKSDKNYKIKFLPVEEGLQIN
ncbi:MAG: hypothetical protein R3A50_04315 [Saprospiraceae bacterium]|nr:hypothetical protein [Bacteroidota bacterium]MCB9319454.1 hypothetical protein [Lewinellaceae bacterium]